MNNKSYRIVYSHNASLEIKAAKEWYNEQRKELVKNLMNDIKSLQTKIKNNPFFAPFVYNDIRSSSCNHFPYSMHYYIDEKRYTVVILSFFHHSRRPYW